MAILSAARPSSPEGVTSPPSSKILQNACTNQKPNGQTSVDKKRASGTQVTVPLFVFEFLSPITPALYIAESTVWCGVHAHSQHIDCETSDHLSI